MAKLDYLALMTNSTVKGTGFAIVFTRYSGRHGRIPVYSEFFLSNFYIQQFYQNIMYY